MKQKVLITGASGFVGFHLIEAAIASGLDIYAAVRKSSDITHLQSCNINYTYPDFTSVDKLRHEFEEKQYDYIIHAAGVTKAKTQDAYNAVNSTYTKNIADAINTSKNAAFKKMVFISSLAALGPLNDTSQLITEETSPSPVTAYGQSKLLAEKQLKSYNFPLTILRPTAVYGPREKDILIILQTIAKGIEPYIGKVAQQLSFVYVKDLAQAVINALLSTQNGTYNITDGNCYNRYELANITKDVLGKKTFKFHLPYNMVKVIALLLEKTYAFTNKTPALNIEKLNELTAINWCCNINKAKDELMFNPNYNLQRGLKESLDWYQQNKWL